MFYFVEIICLGLLGALIKGIRSLRFYNWVIEHNNVVLYDWAENKERFAYNLTKFVMKIPSLSLAPSDYEYYRIEEELRQVTKLKEKMIVRFQLLWLHIKGLFGNVVFDLVVVMSILIREKIIDISKIWDFDSGIDVNLGELVSEVISFCTEYGNVLLIVAIILLAIYAKYIKRKSRKYEFEAIWEKESENDIIQVAQKQREIEESLLSIMNPIYKNNLYCRDELKRLDACKTEAMFVDSPDGYEDYSSEISTIKEKLREIFECTGGYSIYVTHNTNMLLQLSLLGLIPRKEFKYFELDECNKHSFAKVKDSQNKKQFLLYKWMFGVAVLNGIERCLKDSARRKKGYSRLRLSVEAHERLSDIVQKIKG